VGELFARHYFNGFLSGTDARLEGGRYKTCAIVGFGGSTGTKVARYKLSVAERFPSSLAGF